jgi:hypothetical protein
MKSFKGSSNTSICLLLVLRFLGKQEAAEHYFHCITSYCFIQFFFHFTSHCSSCTREPPMHGLQQKNKLYALPWYEWVFMLLPYKACAPFVSEKKIKAKDFVFFWLFEGKTWRILTNIANVPMDCSKREPCHWRWMEMEMKMCCRLVAAWYLVMLFFFS